MKVMERKGSLYYVKVQIGDDIYDKHVILPFGMRRCDLDKAIDLAVKHVFEDNQNTLSGNIVILEVKLVDNNVVILLDNDY